MPNPISNIKKPCLTIDNGQATNYSFMYSIKKSFNFYTLTILLGNLFVWVITAFVDSPVWFLKFEIEALLTLFAATYIFSFPVGITSLIFFSIQKSEWPHFINAVSSSIIMALTISICWALVLSLSIFNNENEFALLGPFILAAPIAAILSELWHELRQSKSEAHRNQQLNVSKLNS